MLADLVLPSGIATLLLIAGLLTGRSIRLRRMSWWLLASSGLVTVVFSSGFVAAALMSPLEYSHPAVHDAARFPQVRHIVVLTGWAGEDSEMPLSGRLNASSAYRVLMALELFNDGSDSDVIVSGNATTARVMGEILVKLGVPAQRLTLESESDSTADSAANLKRIVGENAFFLVTSAGHLPRTMAAMRKQGLSAIPAPTDHQLPKDWQHAEWRPRPGSLVVSDLAVHEHLGYWWYRFTGRI